MTMRTRLTTVAVLALAITTVSFAGPVPARATSFGVYGSLGAGNAEWGDSSFGGSEDPNRIDDTRDTRHGGGGLVLDTAAPFSPVGYRLSIGWERITQDRRFDAPRLELEGVVVDQDLSIQLIGGPGPLRMWFGPELRLAFLNGSLEGAGGNEDFLSLGIGPVFGLDFNVSPGMAISWKLGFLFSGYSGRGRDNSIDDSSLTESHAYASLSLLFSPWGDYRRQPQGQTVPQRGYEPQQPVPPQPPPPPPPPYNPRRW
jgi:hypothetical protein